MAKHSALANRNLTKKQTVELDAAWRQRNRELKQAGIRPDTFEQYLEYVFGKAPKQRPDHSKRLTTNHTVQKVAANCIKDWTTGSCTAKPKTKYTGEKMIGVSIIHKSCLQPIFDEGAAVDAANMRR